MQPRLIRLKDAAKYLAMDKNRFNVEVRPYVTEIPIGKQGIAFDRIDLDEWASQYKARNGRPAKKGGKPWRREKRVVCLSEARRGTLTSESEESAFVKALAKASCKKPRST